MPLRPRISAPVGKSGPGDPGEHRVERLLARGVRVGEQPLGGVGHLAQVVRRDVGGHADRDAGAAVDEQVGEPARQDDGLLRLAVVVVAEVDRVLVDVAHHLHGQRRHPALGVPRRGGRVVARAAEVALAVDQRVAQRPVLHEPDEGVVDRGVTVRVVLTHHLADDAAALVVAAVGPVATVEHRVDHATVHRLEAVAHVGQRAADDHRHRVVDVAALHLGVEVDRLGAVVLDRRYLSHEFPCPSMQFSSVQFKRSRYAAGLGFTWNRRPLPRHTGRSDVEEPHVAGVALDERRAGTRRPRPSGWRRSRRPRPRRRG